MTSFLKYLLCLCCIFIPQIAFAHSPIKGIGDFLNGVLHPIFAPEQLIIILGLGFWYGQHQPNQNKKTILFFLLAIVAGLFASEYLLSFNKSLILLVLAVLIGIFIIIGKNFYQPLLIVLGIISGFLLGLDSVQDDLAGKSKLVALFGSGVGIYFFMLYAMALSETMNSHPWGVIVIRILASWLSASALMVLALGFSQS